eukprot:1158039-Pelagomonas_calceolata.AAC.17
MHAQAATWHLVWCLHCNEMPPAGTGGPEVLDTAGMRTTRQMLADHISSDAQLTRCDKVCLQSFAFARVWVWVRVGVVCVCVMGVSEGDATDCAEITSSCVQPWCAAAAVAVI